MIRTFDGKIKSNHGSPIKVLYEPYYDSDGRLQLRETGKVNTDDEIQSYAESCDLNVILNRFLNGDIEALNKTSGSFIDTTVFPKTYAEFLQKQLDAKLAFDKLPVDIKSKFGNDVNQFFASAGTEEFYKKLGYDTENNLDVNNKKDGEVIE